jgi:hypothetical protein
MTILFAGTLDLGGYGLARDVTSATATTERLYYKHAKIKFGTRQIAVAMNIGADASPMFY